MARRETHAAQLREIFGDRLQMVAAFGSDGAHLCAVVQSLTMGDLEKCAEMLSRWKKAGEHAPLLIPVDELSRGRLPTRHIAPALTTSASSTGIST